MNEIYAIITDSKRSKFFEQILGEKRIPITSPNPRFGKTWGGDLKSFYFLDMTKISDEQRQSFISHIAKTFNLVLEYVSDEIDIVGVPILNKDIIIMMPLSFF
jgi:hypothetical protein